MIGGSIRISNSLLLKLTTYLPHTWMPLGMPLLAIRKIIHVIEVADKKTTVVESERKKMRRLKDEEC